MDERTLQWRVGIVVICAALILAILIFLFGEGWQSQYTLFINTRTAPNVTKNTPVRKNGILIGRVYDVENQDRGVMLTLKINSDESIFENEVCKIGTASFLGDAVIDFVPGIQPGRGDPVSDRMVFSNVAVERNPVEIIDVVMNLEDDVTDTLAAVRQASETFDEAAAGVAEFTDSVQSIFGDGKNEFKDFITNTKNLSLKLDTAVDNFNTLMVNLNDIAGDQQSRDNIKLTIRRLPKILDEFDLAITDTRITLNEFQSVAEGADLNLANLAQFTQALGEQGPEAIENLNASLKKIDAMVNDIGNFTSGLANSNGTVFKLLNDSELYDNLNATLRNVRDISIRIQPLINDLRYAADGIARDPGQLGLRGAFDRSPAFGKFKGTVTGSPRNDW